MSTRSQLRFVQRVDQGRTKRCGPGRTGVPAFGRLPGERAERSRAAEGGNWLIATESHESAVGLENSVSPVHRVNPLGRFLRPIQTLGE